MHNRGGVYILFEKAFVYFLSVYSTGLQSDIDACLVSEGLNFNKITGSTVIAMHFLGHGFLLVLLHAYAIL